MFIYSGKCRMGTVGEETKFTDVYGEKLFVGDIVIVLNNESPVVGLTAVVSDEFTSYSDGTHKVNEKPHDQFIMGIKSVQIDNDEWKALKVKDHMDVVNGENWPQFGFNYKND